MLFTYMQQVQKFLRDTKQDLLDPQDIITHINEARREVAMRAQCIRRLTPITAGLTTISVINGGSLYTNPVITISAPDQPSGFSPYPNGLQATASAILSGGTITAIDVNVGGAGYQNPSITIVDATGHGATASATIAYNQIIQGQEVYNWSDIDLSMFPGVGQVFWIQSMAVIYANWRYVPEYCAFTKYQARVRNYVAQSYQYVPAFFSQYGRGTDGSFFMYPPPSQTYPVEYDCLCLPTDLNSDDDYEAIPQPWQDVVRFLAAHYCFLDIQNLNTARAYLEMYNDQFHRYSSYAMPGRRLSQTGRPV